MADKLTPQVHITIPPENLLKLQQWRKEYEHHMNYIRECELNDYHQGATIDAKAIALNIERTILASVTSFVSYELISFDELPTAKSTIDKFSVGEST